MRIISIIALLLAITCGGHTLAFCQEEGSYSSEISELGASVRSLLNRAEQIKKDNSQAKMQWLGESLELTEKLHQIQMEAATANFKLLQSGQGHNKRLSLVKEICNSQKLLLSLIGTYLDTNDKVFWTAAIQANTLVKSLMKDLKIKQ